MEQMGRWDARLVLGGGEDFGLAGGPHAADVEALLDAQPVEQVARLRRINADAAEMQLCMAGARVLRLPGAQLLDLGDVTGRK